MIPVKCFTCGYVLADKYRYYVERVNEKKDFDEPTYASKDEINKTVEGKILDDLFIRKICCRRHMLTHVDIN
mgnify:CR=1 FL=1|tara:strand:+ start:55 stop:270 length:216 start_codon:yes stop_codon:yes gene_type:complete